MSQELAHVTWRWTRPCHPAGHPRRGPVVSPGAHCFSRMGLVTPTTGSGCRLLWKSSQAPGPALLPVPEHTVTALVCKPITSQDHWAVAVCQPDAQTLLGARVSGCPSWGGQLLGCEGRAQLACAWLSFWQEHDLALSAVTPRRTVCPTERSDSLSRHRRSRLRERRTTTSLGAEGLRLAVWELPAVVWMSQYNYLMSTNPIISKSLPGSEAS